MLIGFSNSIRGAKRFTASKALGNSDNDISCHARNMARGGTGLQLPFPKQAPGNRASRKQPEQSRIPLSRPCASARSRHDNLEHVPLDWLTMKNLDALAVEKKTAPELAEMVGHDDRH